MSQISWEISPWKQLSLVNDGEVISLSHAKVYVFSDSVLCLGNMNQYPISNTVWERQLERFKDSSQYRTLDTIDGEPMEFEWNIFTGCSTLELLREAHDYQFKEEDLGSVGDVSKVCSQVVLKCLYLARIGRPDILWSVNKFARAVPKWTRACDRRLAPLLSYIHHMSDHRQYCHVGDTAQHCRLGLFQDSDFAGDL